MLPIKKIYIDSKYKTIDSRSDSDFKYQLDTTIALPENCVFKVVDVCIPHSWYTIEEDINDKFYFYVSNTNSIDIRPFLFYRVQLTSKNYTSTELAAELQYRLNSAYSVGSSEFTVTYSVGKQTLSISASTTNLTFKVMTESDIKSKLDGFWGSSSNNAPDYDASDPQDLNTNMLKLNTGVSPTYTYSSPYISGYVNLESIRNVYISSPNLSSFDVVGPRPGMRSVIKKVPVTANFNNMIFDAVAYSDDYINCSRQTIQTLEFRLMDCHGKTIPLHGSYVSFSLVFDIQDPKV
jgi:hypothetical protein